MVMSNPPRSPVTRFFVRAAIVAASLLGWTFYKSIQEDDTPEPSGNEEIIQPEQSTLLKPSETPRTINETRSPTRIP